MHIYIHTKINFTWKYCLFIEFIQYILSISIFQHKMLLAFDYAFFF